MKWEDVMEFFVAGTPRPQGSGASIVTKQGRSFKKYPQTTAEWRNRLVAAFGELGTEMIPEGEPVEVELEFLFARPKSHSQKRRHSDGRMKTNGADIDKLTRLVLDALSVSRLVDDDRQVVNLIARKRYVVADDQPEGVLVWLRKPVGAGMGKPTGALAPGAPSAPRSRPGLMSR